MQKALICCDGVVMEFEKFAKPLSRTAISISCPVMPALFQVAEPCARERGTVVSVGWPMVRLPNGVEGESNLWTPGC